jgi:hypothetical protein
MSARLVVAEGLKQRGECVCVLTLQTTQLCSWVFSKAHRHILLKQMKPE